MARMHKSDSKINYSVVDCDSKINNSNNNYTWNCICSYKNKNERTLCVACNTERKFKCYRCDKLSGTYYMKSAKEYKFKCCSGDFFRNLEYNFGYNERECECLQYIESLNILKIDQNKNKYPSGIVKNATEILNDFSHILCSIVKRKYNKMKEKEIINEIKNISFAEDQKKITSNPFKTKYLHRIKDISIANKQELQGDCLICMTNYEETKSLVKTECGHIFCKECLWKWFENKNTCPTCRKNLDLDQVGEKIDIKTAAIICDLLIKTSIKLSMMSMIIIQIIQEAQELIKF